MTLGLRELFAEVIFIDDKLLNENHTYRLTTVLVNIIFFILLPFAVLIFTNVKVYQTLKIMKGKLQKDLNDQRLKRSVFKAKFSIIVAVTFIISHFSKIIGEQGIYGLYVTMADKGHHMNSFSVPYGIRICDGLAFWILTVLNSALPYYVYKWLERRSQEMSGVSGANRARPIFNSTAVDSRADGDLELITDTNH